MQCYVFLLRTTSVATQGCSCNDSLTFNFKEPSCVGRTKTLPSGHWIHIYSLAVQMISGKELCSWINRQRTTDNVTLHGKRKGCVYCWPNRVGREKPRSRQSSYNLKCVVANDSSLRVPTREMTLLPNIVVLHDALQVTAKILVFEIFG